MTPGIHVTPERRLRRASTSTRPAARRRSVYRFVFRTLPDPFLDALDCPDASQSAPVADRVGRRPAGAGAAERPVHRCGSASTSPRGSAKAAPTSSRAGRRGVPAGAAAGRRRDGVERVGRATPRKHGLANAVPGAVQQQRVPVRRLTASDVDASLTAPRVPAGAPAAASAASRWRTCSATTRPLADSPRPELNGGLHHPAKVRRVIQLFMNGGVSQMDTFDYKPELDEAARPDSSTSALQGRRPPARPGRVMKSPFEFKQHGQCGRWVSERLPAPGRVRRRPGVPDGDGVEDERPRPGQLHAEHRLPAARASRASARGSATAWAA